MPRRIKSAPTKNAKPKTTKKRTKSAPTKLSKNIKLRSSSAKSRSSSAKSRSSSAKSRSSSAKSRSSSKSGNSNSGTNENNSSSSSSYVKFGSSESSFSNYSNISNQEVPNQKPQLPPLLPLPPKKKPKPKPKSRRVVKGEKMYQIDGTFLDAEEVLSMENIANRITFVRSTFTKKTTHVWLVQIDGKNTIGFPHISCHNDEGHDSAVIHMRYGNAETEKAIWKKLPHTGDWGRHLQVREFITKDGKGQITGKEPELSLARLIKDKWNQLIAPKYLTDKKLKKFFSKEGTATIQPEDMYLKGGSKSPK